MFQYQEDDVSEASRAEESEVTKESCAEEIEETEATAGNEMDAKRISISERNLWTAEEDEALSASVKKYGGENWKKIAEEIPLQQCYHRWKRINPWRLADDAEQWTPEDDAKLVGLVKRHGKQWTLISKVLKVDSLICRKRWCNHLDPNITNQLLSVTETWTSKDGQDGNQNPEAMNGHNGCGDSNIRNVIDSNNTKKIPREDVVTKKNPDICNEWQVNQKDTESRSIKHIPDKEGSQSAKSRDMDSEAEDMDIRAEISKEENIQVVTIMKTKDSNTKKRPRRDWTFEEDEALRLAVERNVDDDWETIAKNRCLMRTAKKTSKICKLPADNDSNMMEKDINEKDSVQDVRNVEIESLKEQLANNRKHDSIINAQNTEIQSLKELLVKNNLVIEARNKEIQQQLGMNKGKDLVINTQNMVIERLKQQLPKKNEKNLVIDELIERLKQQLSNKTERESVIVALIERLKKQLPKKNEKGSQIEALNKKINEKNLVIDALNKEIERLKEQLAKSNEKDLVIDTTKTANVDVDPLANFPLGSKTLVVGDWCCDVCKEAWFRTYDEACYHESLCPIYRDRIAAKAALEKVNKALLKKMKSISVKYSFTNDRTTEKNVPCPVKKKNTEESMSKRVHEMQALSKDLQKDLQCPICFNPMKDPCIVPECCHRFCYSCIEDAIAKCGKECPVCRARITSKRGLRRDELFGKIAEVVCRNDEEEDSREKS